MVCCCIDEPFSWVDVCWTRSELGPLSSAKATMGDGDEGMV